ncbi:MAG: hypothetical protein GF364_13540 [Candidatus Lokiarchaeota archaeon]|nr:hypothetical protein [Candidatus Lokiarchaeota archaeon]
MNKNLFVSAPGRVCLYGEHQDYLNLVVIPAAIDLRCNIKGQQNTSNKIVLNDKVFREVIEIPFSSQQKSKPFALKENDYFKAVLNIFIKNGDLADVNSQLGFSGELWNQVPVKSGLSSSAALLVCFTKLLDILFETNLSDIEIGSYAYMAEHDEMGIPCGQMDQLASAVGYIFHMKCVEPPIVTKLNKKVPGLVVGDTLIPKSTNSVHSIRVKEITDAIEFLKKNLDFDIEKTKWEEVNDILKDKNEIWFKRMRATLKDRDITDIAYSELRKENPDVEYLGQLLNTHQKYLRDDYEVSVKKIDDMLKAGLDAGALGGKLTGAGMGGSIIMLAPGKQKEVANALTKAGGKGYVVDIDKGVYVEEE